MNKEVKNKKIFYIKSIFSVMGIFLFLDFIWLFVLMGEWYQEMLGHLLSPSPLIFPALLFYFGYPVLLAIIVSWRAEKTKDAFFYGALIGIISYGTYELTNASTLPSWPLSVVFVDILWGMCVSSISAGLGYRMLCKK
jgi:uncharacterized membrane protein